MTKKIISNIILVLAIVLLSSYVQAEFVVNLYSNEFSIATQQDNLKICSCGGKQDQYEITNVGNMPSVFSISIDSAIRQWITYSENTFTLKPGESRVVSVYTSIPCDQEGTYSYDFRVQTNYGRSKHITRDVYSHKCQNIKTTLLYYNKTVGPCETAHYELVIENVASFKDTYTVSLGEYDSYARFSAREITLNPGEKKSIYIDVQMPCERYGSFYLRFHVHSVMNRLDQYTPNELIVTRSYDYSIIVRESSQVCSRVTSKLPVRFTNNAKVPNEYQIGFSGPSFASFQIKELSLMPKESQVHDIILNPGIKNEGTHILVLNAKSSLGGITKTQSVNIDVQRCYDHDVIIMSEKLDKVCCGRKAYTVNLRNSGMYPETFYLRLKAPLWADLSQEEITLRPGQNKDVVLEVDVPCIDEQFEVRVIMESATTGIREDDVVTIRSYGPDSCTRIKVINDNIRIVHETSHADLRIRNVGITDAVYYLDYESRLFRTDVSEISLGAGEETSVRLEAKNMTGYRKGIYLDELNAITASGIKYRETVRITLSDRSIFLRLFDFMNTRTVCMAFMLLFFAGAIAALILLFYKQVLRLFTPEDSTLILRRVSFTSKKKIRAIMIFIAVFILLFALAYALSPRPSYDLVKKPLNFEMWQDTSMKLNIDRYFEDPDGDILFYTVSRSDDLAVDIQGGIATITPAGGWFGERNLVFIADDGKGGRAESAVITVNVLERQKMTAARSFAWYCPLYFVGLLFVVWLVVFAFHIRSGRYVYFYRANRTTSSRRKQSSGKRVK